jgi:hypothetical protein
VTRADTLLAAWLLLCACQRPVDEPVIAARAAPGRVLEFAFGTTDGEEISSITTRGRVTVLVFVTTFDLASQVVAKRLNQVLHAHRPRFNAGAVVLEAPKYAPLADVFRSALELSYKVALADLPNLDREAGLGAIRSVPTVLVLDREGREIVRKPGTCSVSDLEEWIRRAERQ